ncbi:hypothetical protein K458DRAFT_382347 [Lentithecium fluviatile CBS 122367]|uniref:BTB domain-containing protein n=1 Tax=Lentithecium fluviatile CBS 122367 TaxID=1168545 RepID=A0A6G1JKT8_9PLEO|nr:hypothetical protein K458DRAFT_382347 [Lentithecium fluviatile CBS 122367]
MDAAEIEAKDLLPVSKTVEIKVIEEDREKTFTLCREQIIECSPYFEAAFTGSFREADDGFIELRDTEIETFETFFGWLRHWGP